MAHPGKTWSDGQVRAFVEGTLDPQSAASLSAEVHQDLALAQRVANLRAQRRRDNATQATAGPAAAAGAAKADAVARGAAVRPAPSPLWWAGAAATALIAAGIGWNLPRSAPEEALVPGADGLRADGRLERALDRRIAAEGSGEEGVLISLSFKASDGRYCRTFSLDIGIDGIACRGADGWQVETTGRSPSSGMVQDDYQRQASSELSPSVMAGIARWQAGDALTPEEERHLREQGWRQR